jgi:glycolate oxidase FAD binding subunit
VDETTCTIDELGPLPVLRPDSPAEVGEMVRRAAGQGQAVYPLGGQTMLDVGLPPTRTGVALDLRGLGRVIDHPARDMTITVQAGITLAELKKVLDAEAQRLPIDVPQPHRATLGGAMATNTSGPRRLGARTLRDYVIGITTINDRGQETKAGGQVVKNVAGYDLCKLHVGALGTLGIITQVTLKIRPKPETQALLTFSCTTAALGGLLEKLHESRTRPMCVELLNDRAARAVRATLPVHGGLALPEGQWVLVVGFEDSEASVNWQIQQLIKELTSAGVSSVEALAGTVADPLWQALTEFTRPGDAVLTVKANLLPGRTAGWCLRADGLSEGLHLHAHAESGIVRGHLAGDLTLERAAAMLKELTAEAVATGGNLVLRRCPTAWKRSLPVWGVPRGDAALMRRVKEQLDPGGLFNPGRFVDGI